MAFNSSCLGARYGNVCQPAGATCTAASDQAAWRKRLDDLYRPLHPAAWLDERDPTPRRRKPEDIVQEVMGVLVRELPETFSAAGRTGSFRRWLRGEISTSWHRLPHPSAAPAATAATRALAAPPEECLLTQLADPNSELSRQWDEDHDRYVLRPARMELIEPMFEAQPPWPPSAAWQILDSIALGGRSRGIGAVAQRRSLIAKSRVLR